MGAAATVCCWHQDQLLDTTSRSGFLCRPEVLHARKPRACISAPRNDVGARAAGLLPQWIFRLHELRFPSHGVGQSRGRLLLNPTLAHVGRDGPRTHSAQVHNWAWQASLPCAQPQKLRARLHPSIPTSSSPLSPTCWPPLHCSLWIRILPLNSDFPTQSLSSSAQPHLRKQFRCHLLHHPPHS